MRPTSPSRYRQTGFSLIEIVIAIVVTGIIVGAVAYFLYPVRQAIDVSLRAELTDIADTAVQRIGRDVRLALPNSVRVNSEPTNEFLEFLAIRSAGRFRSDGGGAAAGVNCPNDDAALGVPDNDLLTFDSASDSCFKTIGKLPNASEIVGTDELVLNNHGPGFTGQDAYAIAGTLNRAGISAVDSASETNRDRVALDAPASFDRTLHESPGRRFFIISGPVAYRCDKIAGTVTRYWNYAIRPEAPGIAGSQYLAGSSAIIATKVSDCLFDYSQNVAPRVGLLTLRLELTGQTSGGSPERVALYHAIHVSNVP